MGMRSLLLCQIFPVCFAQMAFAQTESVKLAWIQIPNAVAYEVEVASAGAHGRPLIFRAVTIPEITVNLPLGSFVYRARLVVSNGSKGPWSELQPFEVKPEAIAL